MQPFNAQIMTNETGEHRVRFTANPRTTKELLDAIRGAGGKAWLEEHTGGVGSGRQTLDAPESEGASLMRLLASAATQGSPVAGQALIALDGTRKGHLLAHATCPSRNDRWPTLG